MFAVHECCRKYARSITRAVNIASMADKHLPVAGGLLDQSAWFLDFWNALQSDQNEIDAERLKDYK